MPTTPPRSIDDLARDVAAAVARARMAVKRMSLAHSLADDVGVQMAYQAVLFNQVLIGEAVAEVPAEARVSRPDVDWEHLAGLRSVVRDRYVRIDAEQVHRMVDEDFAAAEAAVGGLRTPLHP